jgi:hypothetical protein
MGHRTQTSMFNIGVDIGSDHRWVGNIEQKTSIFLNIDGIKNWGENSHLIILN